MCAADQTKARREEKNTRRTTRKFARAVDGASEFSAFFVQGETNAYRCSLQLGLVHSGAWRAGRRTTGTRTGQRGFRRSNAMESIWSQ